MGIFGVCWTCVQGYLPLREEEITEVSPRAGPTLQSRPQVRTGLQNRAGLTNHADAGAGLKNHADAGEGADDEQERLCTFGCGRPVQPGRTKNNKPYVTCCRGCALNPGLGIHDATCGRAGSIEPLRKACPEGSRCRRRDKAHLDSEAHPLNQDYAACCFASGIEPEQISLKVIFDWSDADGSGKLSREELAATLDDIRQICGDALPDITDEAWHHLDEDGNGVVNFGEFASWAGPRLGLPLGMERLARRRTGTKNFAEPCSVLGCPCECFMGTKNKCSTCKHKKALHVAPQHIGEVPYPDYWETPKKRSAAEFTEMVELKPAAAEEFQGLLTKTYANKWTRDRTKHNPTKTQVPTGFKVVKVFRNENSRNWSGYGCRRADIMTRIDEKSGAYATPIELYKNVKSMVAWREVGGPKADRLLHECNEWYLFHGTHSAAAKKICATDFRVGTAGGSTGTLYGKGLYFAESVTKADEYAKPDEKGNHAVLLCRVIGGKVKYTAEVEPDREDLVYQCIEGPYDCVLGDREKCRNTYREFILYDSEDVYPEYLIEYQRLY